MTVEEILDALDTTRERLLLAIEPLPDEALEQPGAVGDWSVRDVLAHLAAWESELITGLMRLDQGKKPEHLLAATADRNAYNARRYEENKGRDLDRVFADFQDARTQLEGWLDEFSERALNDPNRYQALNGQPLWKIISLTSFGHEAMHITALEAFAARWQNSHNESHS